MSENYIPPMVPSADTLRDLQDLTGWNLRIPENAQTRGTRYEDGRINPKFSAVWPEQMEITSSLMKASAREDRKGCYEVWLKFTVTGEGENVGRKFSTIVALDPAQLQRGENVQSALGKGGLFNMHRLNDLLRALGYQANGSGMDYTEYFHSPNGVAAQVVGQSLVVSIRHYVGKDGKEYQDASGFAAIS